MAEAVADRRRSSRLVLDVGLIVRGEGFEESTFTVSVSQHGALIMLETLVEIGQKIFIRNALKGPEIEGKVVRIGSPHGGLRMVGIDFLQPSPEFWLSAKNMVK
jgi:hypothetical protein